MNAIAQMLGVESSTVLYWVRNFALKAYEKPMPKGDAAIELDEMGISWSQKNQVWIWKA